MSLEKTDGCLLNVPMLLQRDGFPEETLLFSIDSQELGRGVTQQKRGNHVIPLSVRSGTTDE